MKKKVIDRITIQERGKNNFTGYIIENFALKIHSFTYKALEDNKLSGYVYGWELVSKNHYCKGNDVKSLLDTFDELKKAFNLGWTSPHKKDVILVWTDNIKKVYGFLQKYVTDKSFFPKYIQINEFFEVRPMKIWNSDLKDIKKIAEYGQQLTDNIFINEKYFAITANQRPRRAIEKATKKAECTVAKDIFPHTWSDYAYIKQALFGGLCYCPFPGLIIDQPMLAIDLNSAYIYCLLIEKHCISTRKAVDKNNWEFYLDNPDKMSIGTYKIKYSTWTNKISCYKNAFGEKLQKGIKEDTLILTNIDLKILLSLVTVNEVECLSLQEYDLDYLPGSIRDVIVNEYIKKEYIKKTGTDFEITLQKSVVNGIYGDTIRKYLTKEEYEKAYKNAFIAPQWGVMTTSYCKKLLLELGDKLQGWYYSDTDSIYCLDTEENRQLIQEFNENINAKVKAFCEKFGYDFESMKNLGTFKIEAEITKFKANHQKQYMYITKDGTMVVKAAGLEKEKRNINESLFDMKEIPFGKKTVSDIRSDTTTCKIGDMTFVSEGSYYEADLEGETLKRYLASHWDET